MSKITEYPQLDNNRIVIFFKVTYLWIYRKSMIKKASNKGAMYVVIAHNMRVKYVVLCYA